MLTGKLTTAADGPNLSAPSSRGALCTRYLGFEITDVQAEAILNLRLRRLHKLEEVEIRTEHEKLSEEKAGIEALLASEETQWNN